MPRRPLVQQANAQAATEYAPVRRATEREIRGTRRDTRGSIQSLRSMENALQQSLRYAERELRQAGLQGDDLRMALSELASRAVDVTAGTALQVQQTRREGLESVGDLRQELVALARDQGSAAATTLGELRGAATERRQEVADQAHDDREARLQDRRDFQYDVLRDQRGVSDEGGGGDGDALAQALVAARRLYRMAEADQAEQQGIGGWMREQSPGPPTTQEQWDGFTEALLQADGVNDQRVAQQAAAVLRNEVGGGDARGQRPPQRKPPDPRDLLGKILRDKLPASP